MCDIWKRDAVEQSSLHVAEMGKGLAKISGHPGDIEVPAVGHAEVLAPQQPDGAVREQFAPRNRAMSPRIFFRVRQQT